MFHIEHQRMKITKKKRYTDTWTTIPYNVVKVEQVEENRSRNRRGSYSVQHVYTKSKQNDNTIQ